MPYFFRFCEKKRVIPQVLLTDFWDTLLSGTNLQESFFENKFKDN